MKILIVNTSDIQGGAARAAYRLHKSLLHQGINSQMLVQNKSSDDFTVLTSGNKITKGLNNFRFVLDQLPLWCYKNKDKTLFSTAWLKSGIIKEINKINPDIVHLHWICGGLLKLEDIKKIKAPIVWSLHDNWAFTGGCHIMWNCDKYKTGCATCPRLTSTKKNDLSKKIFKRKIKVYNRIENLTIIGLSKWLNECSKNSILLKNKKHINLPNPIDTQSFKAFDKNKARELWGLPQSKKLILFGAMSATSDVNKGFEVLSDTIKKLTSKNIELVVFGSSKPKKSQNFGFKTNYLGHLHENVSLTTLYSAADVMIVPSLQENLSNAIMESLSCGTPVVGFDIGGNSDMINHKKNGYLAQPFDTGDLMKGIQWVLNNPNYDKLCKNARERVLKEFDSKIVAKRYEKLYKSILKDKSV